MRSPFLTALAAIALATEFLPLTSAAQDADAQPAWMSSAIVTDSELAGQRGGADTHINENNASAVVRDNVATNLSTGNNSIHGDSFSGMSGVPMVVQNSGNNVVIQNSTILNLQLQ